MCLTLSGSQEMNLKEFYQIPIPFGWIFVLNLKKISSAARRGCGGDRVGRLGAVYVAVGTKLCR